jgi:RNA polymerase sigma-70 factor, ECF subfamily
VAAVLRKDRKATGEFIARYTQPVYGYVRSRLAPRTDLVDDVVQEVFLAAWQGLGDFRGESNLRAWLLGIARHKVEDYYRAQLRQPDPLDDVEEDLTQQAAPTPTLDEMLDSDRLGQKALRVLGDLPEPYRLVLLWRYWEKIPAREMAARSGRTEKAVERLLARAREQFKLRWEND